jgi:hypothetical protein
VGENEDEDEKVEGKRKRTRRYGRKWKEQEKEKEGIAAHNVCIRLLNALRFRFCRANGAATSTGFHVGFAQA